MRAVESCREVEARTSEVIWNQCCLCNANNSRVTSYGEVTRELVVSSGGIVCSSGSQRRARITRTRDGPHPSTLLGRALRGVAADLGVMVSKIGKFCKIFANFWRARSRRYQNEFLQENMRLTAFFKLYKICLLLHRCNLKFLTKNRFDKSAFFVKN